MGDSEREDIARRAQELANSGDFEGFNALSSVLENEYSARAVDPLRRDQEFRRSITERCQVAWTRKHG
jgi:hypothetical protein